MAQQPEPVAILFTFTCYGSRLHGDERGTVDRHHRAVGEDFVQPSVARVRQAMARQSERGYVLDQVRRGIVLQGLLDSFCRLGAVCHALHIRRDHVHVVLSTDRRPDVVLAHMKARATVALGRSGIDGARVHKRWARHGSTRMLWDVADLAPAVDYVVRQQGEPMVVYVNPDAR